MGTVAGGGRGARKAGKVSSCLLPKDEWGTEKILGWFKSPGLALVPDKLCNSGQSLMVLSFLICSVR